MSGTGSKGGCKKGKKWKRLDEVRHGILVKSNEESILAEQLDNSNAEDAEEPTVSASEEEE